MGDTLKEKGTIPPVVRIYLISYFLFNNKLLHSKFLIVPITALLWYLYVILNTRINITTTEYYA